MDGTEGRRSNMKWASSGSQRIGQWAGRLRPWGSIRGRLLSLLLAAGVLIAAATFAYQLQARSQRIDERKDEVLQLSQLAAQVERQRIEAARGLLIAASQFSPVIDAANNPTDAGLATLCQRRLASATDLLPDVYAGIGLADLQGNVICTRDPVVPGAINIADRLFFQQALASRDFAIGQFHYARPSGQPVIGFGYPVRTSSGAVIGILTTGFDLRHDDELISDANLPRGASVTVLDRNGVTLRGTEDEIGRQSVDVPMLGLSADFQSRLSDGTNGGSVAVTRVTDGSATPVYVALFVPGSYIGSLVSWDLLQQWVLVAEIIALATLVFLIVANRLIERPIARLGRQTDALAAGDVGARSGIAHSSTEIGRLAEQFDEMAGQLERTLAERDRALMELEQAIESKDEFVGMVSHEMRNMITPITGGASILERHMERLDPESRAELVTAIRESGEMLNRLIGDMFVLARMELGGHLEREPIAAERLCWAIRDEFARLAPSRPLELGLQGRNYVEAEESYLHQILVNLLTNADKYSPPGESIRLSVGTNGAGQIEFAVADRGPGVEAHEIDRIFDRYYRSPQAPSPVGTGLGLTVCKRLVEAQGGRIWARLRDGGGLEIAFTLAPATLAGPETIAPAPERSAARDTLPALEMVPAPDEAGEEPASVVPG